MYLLLLVCLVLSLVEAAPRGSRDGAYCEVVVVTTTMDQSTMTSRVSTESTPTTSATSYEKMPIGSDQDGGSNVWTTMTRPAPSTWIGRTTKSSTSPSSVSSSAASKIATFSSERRRKKKNGLYFTNWSIYINFTLNDISFKHVTHLLYSFVTSSPDASLAWSDQNADTLQRLGTVEKREQSVARENIGQLFEIKKKYRSLKTLDSVGGASGSKDGIVTFAARAIRSRDAFANSVVKMISEHPFDGLNLDGEFPGYDEADNLLALIKQVRRALKKYARQNDQNYHYQPTVAVSANKDNYGLLDLKGLNRFVDAWHLMAYDYSGSWSQVASHQAAVFKDAWDPNTTEVATDPALQDYMDQRVSSEKTVLGMPLYGRVFKNTAGLGYLFDNADSDSDSDTSSNPIETSPQYLYNQIIADDPVVHVDANVMAAWTQDETSRELVSFYNTDTAKLKAQSVDMNDLAGAMFWDASEGTPGNASLVKPIAQKRGNLYDSENILDYLLTPWSNFQHYGHGSEY